MIGIMGVQAILGCGTLIAGLIVGAVSIAVSVGVGVSQAQQAEELQDEMLDKQDEAEEKAENRLQAQKDMAYKQNERKHLKNIMAMGSAIMVEQFRSRKTKYETIAVMKADAGSKPKGYNYGKPAQPAGGSEQSNSQSQGQTNA
ncbi:MAG: hypothetical protein JXA24_01870 [Proteobacteria bacterium]|nr:hypothetical protein [Pseudomonadota bacterium]